MYRYYEYKKKLDKLLEQLRAKYMGQDVPLSQLLPVPQDLSPNRMAEQLAYIFTLYLQRTREMTEREIKDAWRWLRAAIRFLWDCPESDRITGSILRLAELNEATRRHLELDTMPLDWAEGFYLEPPGAEDISAAIWLMEERERKALVKIEAFCEEDLGK